MILQALCRDRIIHYGQKILSQIAKNNESLIISGQYRTGISSLHKALTAAAFNRIIEDQPVGLIVIVKAVNGLIGAHLHIGVGIDHLEVQAVQTVF